MTQDSPTCAYCHATLTGTYLHIDGADYCDNGQCGRNMSRQKRGAEPLPPFGTPRPFRQK